MTLSMYTYELALAQPFQIAHETRTTQPTLIVALRDGQRVGYGEATATRYYGLEVHQMEVVLERLRPLIESTPLEHPDQYWEALYPHLRDHPFELCALDVAANDLWARRLGRPLYELWGLDPNRGPLTNYTIGIDRIEAMQARILETPWPLYKIKLGAGDDLRIIRALRAVTDAPFRVDANTAWTARQTIDYAPRLAALGVEFIEQPLPPDDRTGMAAVFAESVLPVIADESCQTEADVEACHGLFHGINIKLMKCGGLTPARRMIARARALGMQVMVGCMTESSIGISAIAQLNPLLDYVDMDGALLLRQDIASGVRLEAGRVRYPERPGTGAELTLLPQ